MSNKSDFLENVIEQSKARMMRLSKFMESGVTIIDPVTTYIADGVTVGEGTIIYPLTVIEKDVHIGKNCKIGPFARLRSHVTLEDEVIIGNFVEVNHSSISRGSKAKHLSYLGDTIIEDNVNIGAGTIIANYDGTAKHKTRIRTNAFIGSGSILVAPVTVGKKAVTGAGCVVTKNKDVADNTIVVGVPARVLKKKT